MFETTFQNEAYRSYTTQNEGGIEQRVLLVRAKNGSKLNCANHVAIVQILSSWLNTLNTREKSIVIWHWFN